MSSTGNRPSRAVYRRRRLVLLTGIVVVAALIVWLFVAQPWAGASDEAGASIDAPAASETPLEAPSDPDAAATPPPEADPGSEPEPDDSDTPEPAPTGPVACVAADILVEALTDKVTYAAGEQPQLSIQLTNRGDACTLNVGTTQQKLTVMSGGDTWWRSTDCQSEPSDMEVLIGAGETVKSGVPVVWERVRSSPSTCDDPNRPVAPGSGASYHVSVEIGGIASRSTQQILLYG